MKAARFGRPFLFLQASYIFHMPSINLSVPHKLGVDEAKRRITNLKIE
jgi:hypothetical protein